MSVIAVVGAHGKTGRALASALERRGAAVRPIGRRELADPDAALRGCDAVYVIAPNMYADELAFVDQIVGAAENAGLARVVYHSVAAAYAPSMPHHLGKARSEDRVRRGQLPWTILQPCAYLQNLVPALAGPEPQLCVPYDTGRLFGFVDLADVAEAAAEVLLADGHAGATYELGGPALLSVADVAEVAGGVLGRTVVAAVLAPAAWRAAEGPALAPRVRDWLLAMFAYYDRYGLPCGSLSLAALLGRPATDAAITLRRELMSPASR